MARCGGVRLLAARRWNCPLVLGARALGWLRYATRSRAKAPELAATLQGLSLGALVIRIIPDMASCQLQLPQGLGQSEMVGDSDDERSKAQTLSVAASSGALARDRVA